MNKLVNIVKRVANFFWKRKKLTALIVVLATVGFIYVKKAGIIGTKDGLQETKIERGEVIEELILSGEIAASQHAKLGFEISGQVNYVAVNEGDSVKKGQVLAKLDTTSLNSTYQRALADLRAAEAAVDKIHDDVKNHSSDETYTQRDTRTTAEVAKDKAYEAVIIAERNLKAATLRSPFDGIVTYVENPFPGANVLYTQTQFEIVNPKTVYFTVTADQTEIIKIKKDQEVLITLDALPEQQFKGKVENIALTPTEDEVGTVYEIKVIFTDSKLEEFNYRIGMTGDVLFVIDKKENVLFVPPSFVKSDKNGKYLLINGGRKKEYIQIGLEGEEKVEVSGNIKEGDTIYD